MTARAGIAVVLLLGGCAVGPAYHPPQTSLPAQFGEVGAMPASAPVAAWWATFRDPVLDSLVARAVAANPDLRAAAARVQAARALSSSADAERFPSIDVGGGASRVRTSERLGGAPGGTSNLFRAGFDAAWEADVFGGLRRESEAADADLESAIEDRRDVHVTLLAEVARNYVELRSAQRRGAIAGQNLAAQRQTLELTRTRVSGGLGTDLDAARAEVQVSFTEAQLPAFATTARQAIHALCVLVAEAPGALAAELTPDGAIPAPPPEIPVGVPSDLLRRRPDVRRAERALAAATARIGAATADFFPSFSLTGALGLASDATGDLFDIRSRTGSMGAALRWPVLDFGRVRAAVDLANAREEEAAALYEIAVLRSLRDVEDALVAFTNERSRHASFGTAAAASRRAVELADQLWKGGRTDFLSVLDTQRDVFVAEDAVVESERRAAVSLIALYKALGGGWETEPAATPAPPRGEPGRRVLDLSQPAAR